MSGLFLFFPALVCFLLLLAHSAFFRGRKDTLVFFLGIFIIGMLKEAATLSAAAEYSFHYLGPSLLGIPVIVPVGWGIAFYLGWTFSETLLRNTRFQNSLFAVLLLSLLVIFCISFAVEVTGANAGWWRWNRQNFEDPVQPGPWIFNSPFFVFIGWMSFGMFYMTGFFLFEKTSWRKLKFKYVYFFLWMTLFFAGKALTGPLFNAVPFLFVLCAPWLFRKALPGEPSFLGTIPAAFLKNDKTPAQSPSLRIFLFLLFDALAFSYCLYQVGHVTLLWRETLLPFYSMFFFPAASFGILFSLFWLSPLSEASEKTLHRPLILLSSLLIFLAFLVSPVHHLVFVLLPFLLVMVLIPRLPLSLKFKNGLLDVFLFFLLSFIAPFAASFHTPTIDKAHASAVSFLWMPIEWHKLPMNLGFIMKTFPFFTAGLIAFHLFSLWVLIFRGRKREAAFAYVFLAVWIMSRVSLMHAGERKIFFWAVFATPYFLMAAGALLGRFRFVARFSVLSFAIAVLWGFYTALLPFSSASGKNLPEGIEIMYPKDGAKKDFPTEYMRDVYVDEEAGYLYTCFGPTSGVVRIHLKTGKADILHTKGLLRHLWTEKNSPYLYGVDWIYDELWLIRKNNFALEKTVFLWDPALVQPIDLVLSEDSIFVVSTEYPALTRFDRKTYKKTGQINFREEGFTKFKSGAWVVSRDKEKKKLFVHLGMVNAQNDFIVARVDEKTFSVDGTLTLKGGGLTMLSVPEKRSVLLGDFYSDLLYEIDMDTLKLKRKIRSVKNCRSLAYDAKRDLLYAASFITGEMAAFRYSDGKILKKAFVGKKPSGMALTPGNGALYFGSHFGVMRVDLKVFLK